ncbi:MAG: D-alanine--D-alanine ligase [Dehalococcoidia bacterium]|nr:D-alanine--D-alanine ligase [Dehalococcoidia bacterium]
MSDKLRVGVLFGGRSGEHDISILSARSIINVLDKTKYTVVPIGIGRNGRWLSEGRSQQMLTPGYQRLEQDTTGPNKLLVSAEELGRLNEVDVVFPALHGPHGEDGTVQGFLDVVGVPYVGADVLGSAVGMDKAVMKALLSFHGLPVPDYQVVYKKELESDAQFVIGKVEKRFTYPFFVKPANLGSSVGISKVKSRGEVDDALSEAARWDRKILVEEAVDGREIECSILGNEEPVASVPGEIVPSREFYDYFAKYHDETTRLIIPADLSQELVKEVQRLAVLAFKVLDCSGMARVDMFLSRSTDKIYINEINTIPGFTSVSMYPKLWEASGLSYTGLLDKLIALALGRCQ